MNDLHLVFTYHTTGDGPSGVFGDIFGIARPCVFAGSQRANGDTALTMSRQLTVNTQLPRWIKRSILAH